MDPEQQAPEAAPSTPAASTEAGGLRPLPLQPTLGKIAPESEDPVEQYLEQNPTAPETPAPEKPDVAPVGTPPATDDAPAATPLAEKPTGQVPPVPGAKPVDAVETPTPSEPTAPVAKVYDLNEKFALADGADWTRGQVLKGLEERASLLAEKPLIEEAKAFKEIFRMDATQAREAWVPMLEQLGREPQTREFIADVIDKSSPERIAYLERCARFFDTGDENQPIAAQPQRPQQDPVLRQQLSDLQAFKAKMEERDAINKINDEIRQINGWYPWLMHDQESWNDLRMTAQALNAQDPSKGLLDVVRSRRSLYDAKSIVLSAPVAPAAAAPGGGPPPIPAVLGSAGAAPGINKPAESRPQKFTDLTDAVDAWVEKHPD